MATVKDLLEIAREAEDVAREVRKALMHLDPTKQGEIETLRYCGTLLSLTSSTLENLHRKLHPVFSMKAVNGILREWGARELTDD